MITTGLFRRKTPRIPGRGVHLDLKGMPPTFPRLLQIVDICAELRVNFILAEFEDMFPWTRRILRSKNAYTPAEIERFRLRCRQHGISIVPLVQSYGHLENILSRSLFERWRENKDDPRTACPMRGGAREIINDMLEDILRALPDVEHVHLGGDETVHAGSCPRCRAYVARRGASALYRTQLDPLIRLLRKRSVRPIVWHDALITWTPAQLRAFGETTDVMLWIYDHRTWTHNEWHPEIPTRKFLAKFLRAQLTLWGAGAYRCGGEGPVPNISLRTENMREWTQQAPSLRIRNVAATGWSRGGFSRAAYGPGENAVDSLCLAALILWNGNYVISRDITRIHRTFQGIINTRIDDANRELLLLLHRLDNIYQALGEDRGLRENCFGNAAAIRQCLRDYDREKRRFSLIEKLYRQALRGQVASDDIAQWIDGYRMAASDRFIGLAVNGLARERYTGLLERHLPFRFEETAGR